MNKKKNNIKVELILFIAILVFVVASVLAKIFANTDDSFWQFLEAVATVVSILGAAIGLGFESRSSRELQEADFLLELNNTYANNQQFADTYSFLEYEYFEERKKRFPKETNPYEGKEKPKEPDRVQLSNYLTFFESIYLLISKGTIKIEKLDNLFGYRFFLVVHSTYVQDQKLVAQPDNFKNIYLLEKIWMEYRKNDPARIFAYDNRLQNACTKAGKEEDYNRIVGDIGTI